MQLSSVLTACSKRNVGGHEGRVDVLVVEEKKEEEPSSQQKSE